MPADAVDRSMRALGVLDEPTRRRLYLFVRAAGHPVTRDEGAAHAGISRKLAAFHLERLVDAGLLVPGPTPHRRERRRGRARKTYEPSGLALDVSIPLIGMLKRKGEKILIDTALKGLKRRVESLR